MDSLLQFRFNQYFVLFLSANDISRRKISTVPIAFDVNSEIC